MYLLSAIVCREFDIPFGMNILRCNVLCRGEGGLFHVAAETQVSGLADLGAKSDDLIGQRISA